MITLDATQSKVLGYAATNPVYLLEIDWGGIQLWSTNGEREVGVDLYTTGSVSVRGAQNWANASIAIPASPANTERLMSGDWRGKQCRVSLLPLKEHPPLIAPGYVLDGYGVIGTEQGEPILLLDGVLTAATYNGNDQINLDVRHQAVAGKWAPRTRVTREIAHHMPPPGTRYERGGEVYVLGAR